eukprot:gene9623-12958_t
MSLTLPEEEVEGLIFDCDGTLVDTMPAYWESWCRVCEKFDLQMTEEEFYSYAGTPVRDIVILLIEKCGKTGLLNPDEVYETKKLFGKFAVEKVGTPPIDCVVQIAEYYYKKKPMAVASSGTRVNVMRSLESTGIAHLFDAVVTAEDIINPKPAPDIFLEAARRINCNPNKCRGYEDADLGMISLNSAGMEAIDVRELTGYPRKYL